MSMTNGTTTCGGCLDKKTICLVTGASRGIGYEIAHRLTTKLGANSVIILVSSNAETLAVVADELRQLCNHIYVIEMQIDLALCDFETALNLKLHEVVTTYGEFEASILVHNAGTLGDLSRKAIDHHRAEEISTYMNLNFTSMLIVNSSFLRQFAKEYSVNFVVNITSLYGIIGGASFSLYTSAKHAREGFMKVLAIENSNIRVLNYSPGPVKTDMQTIIKDTTFDQSTRDFTTNSLKANTLVTCEETVDKLMQILELNSFKSGSHVDYYQ